MPLEQDIIRPQINSSSVSQGASLASRDIISPSLMTGLPDMNRFPDTMGYPEIQGGTEEQGDMDWELFRQSSEQWFRKHLPNVGDEEIVMLIERVEIARLVGQYEILKQEQSTSLEILSALEVEIRKRRERIKDL